MRTKLPLASNRVQRDGSFNAQRQHVRFSTGQAADMVKSRDSCRSAPGLCHDALPCRCPAVRHRRFLIDVAVSRDNPSVERMRREGLHIYGHGKPGMFFYLF